MNIDLIKSETQLLHYCTGKFSCSSSCFAESEHQIIETVDSSRSSSSERVQDFLPYFKPLHVSLISLFFCGVLWMKDEATNERCQKRLHPERFPYGVALQMDSFRSMEEPRVSPFEKKSAQDGSKRLHNPSGMNVLVTWQCKFRVEGLPSSSVCFLVRSIAQLWQSGSSIILTRRERNE